MCSETINAHRKRGEMPKSKIQKIGQFENRQQRLFGKNKKLDVANFLQTSKSINPRNDNNNTYTVRDPII